VLGWSLRETSVIVSLASRQHGKLRLVARGVRAPRSRAGASLEPGNEVDFVFTLQPGRDLGNLREAALIHPWVAGLGRLEPMAVAWAALEMLERIVPEGAPEDGLLDDVWGLFEALGRAPDRAGAVLLFYAFELKLPSASGISALESAGSAVGAGRRLPSTRRMARSSVALALAPRRDCAYDPRSCRFFCACRRRHGRSPWCRRSELASKSAVLHGLRRVIWIPRSCARSAQKSGRRKTHCAGNEID
jgi:hypothetical protein